MIEISVYYPVAKGISNPSCDKVRIEFALPKRPYLFWVDDRMDAEIPYPRGYGVAWCEIWTGKLLLAPIPFNVLIGFSIWLWSWLRWGAARWFWKHSKAARQNRLSEKP